MENVKIHENPKTDLSAYLSRVKKRSEENFDFAYRTLELEYQKCSAIYQSILSDLFEKLTVSLSANNNDGLDYVDILRQYITLPLPEESEKYRLGCINFIKRWEDFTDCFEIKARSLIDGVVERVKDLSDFIERIEVEKIPFGVTSLLTLANIVEQLMQLVNHWYRIATRSNKVDLFAYGLNILGVNKHTYLKQISKLVKDLIGGCGVINELKTIFDLIPKDVNQEKGEIRINVICKFCPGDLYVNIARYAYKKGEVSLDTVCSPYVDFNLGLDANGHFSDMGLEGCVIKNSRNDEIIVGFSGTKGLFSNTFIVDLSQIIGLSPTYIKAAGLVKYIKDKHKNVIVCGHSLGGGLAQFSAIPYKGKVMAVCYNAAGLFKESLNLVKNNKVRNIIHIRMKNDVVSQIGCLVGYVMTINSPLGCIDSHSKEKLAEGLKTCGFV